MKTISYIATALLLLSISGPSFADGLTKGQNTPIHITSDRLDAYSSSEHALFTGHVHAVSANFEIKSDSLDLFYTNNPQTNGNEPISLGTGKAVEKIIATGNVTIVSMGKTAKTEKAVYSRNTGKVVLIGPGSSVTGENGTIAGEKITLDTVTGDVTVESSGQTRVKAVIQPKTLDSGKPREIKQDR